MAASPSFHPAPRKPRLRLPRGACDAHFHVFGIVVQSAAHGFDNSAAI